MASSQQYIAATYGAGFLSCSAAKERSRDSDCRETDNSAKNNGAKPSPGMTCRRIFDATRADRAIFGNLHCLTPSLLRPAPIVALSLFVMMEVRG